MVTCICATHIDSVDRINLLHDMLQSYYEQYLLGSTMHLILSADTQVLLDGALAQIQDLPSHHRYSHHSKVVVHMHTGTQFEKIKKFMDSTSEDLGWIIFSDDDDLWHYDRVLVFYEGTNSASNDIVWVKNLAMNFSQEHQKYKTSEEVTEALTQDQLVNRTDRISYVQFAVKHAVLKEFLRKANVAHKCTDSVFCRYLQHNFVITVHETNTWMYFFRSHPRQLCRLVEKHELEDAVDNTA